MVDFIGTGSAFNTKLGNTSAFVKKNTSLLLIDCGGTVFHRLQKFNLLDGIESLYIVITHTHPDHVGSLGDTIFYSYFILKHKPTIFFSNKEVIEGLLDKLGVTSEMYNLNTSDKVEVNDSQLGEFNIEFVPVSHVNTIPTHGFIMKLNNEIFYYSGDANSININILEKFKKGKINKIYQDTCGLDYDGNAHLSLKKLCEAIPEELRDNVYCMHLDEHVTEKAIEDNGFKLAKVSENK